MAVYKRGRVYHYDFSFRGRRYTGSTKQTSLTAAREVEIEERRKLRAGLRGDKPIDDITVAELAEKYAKLHIANKRSPKFFEYSIKPFVTQFGRRRLSRLDESDLDEFIAKRRAGVAPSTANQTLAVVRHMLKLAIRWGHLTTNPAAGIKALKVSNQVERYLTEDEARQLLAACPGWLRPLVLVALHTGARKGELLALTWSDVDLDGRRIKFRVTKNGEPRTVTMSGDVYEALRALPSRFEGGRVFWNVSGQPVGRESVALEFRAVRSGVEIDDFRFHDLRHSAASFMIQAGRPLTEVQNILGHKSITMTQRYAHLAPEHQAGAMAVMDALNLTTPNKTPNSETGAVPGKSS